MARYYRVDSRKLTMLRKQGGWDDVEEFAEAAGVSPQIVRRAESNGRTYARNIKKLARPLRLDDWHDLLAPQDVQNGQITVEMVLDLSKVEANALSSLIKLIEECVDLRNDIKGITIKYGSVIVQFVSHEEDAENFVYAFGSGRLRPLRVRIIRFHIPEAMCHLPILSYLNNPVIPSTSTSDRTPLWLIHLFHVILAYKSDLSAKFSGRILSIHIRSQKGAPTSLLPTP